MAQLPSVTPYNITVTGVGGAATPSVGFGAQRRPDVAYQAQAEYQQTLSKTLDRISGALFGMAEVSSTRAGKQFVADNPLSKEQLDAMVSGQPGVIDMGSPFNAYSSAVRKARAIELSAYAEVEGQKMIETLEAGVAMGQVEALDAMNQFNNFVDGVSSSLAEQEPDASFKFRASMATVGRSFINNVASTQLKRFQEQNRAITDESFRLTMVDIGRELTKETPDPQVFDVIERMKQKFLVNSTTLVGNTNAGAYVPRFEKEILEIQQNMARSYISAGTDPYEQYEKIRLGKTGNSLLDALTGIDAPTRRPLMDAARKELVEAESIRKEQETIQQRAGQDLEVSFVDAMATRDMGQMKSVLDRLRNTDPTRYVKLKKDYENFDAVFAVRDDGNVVADLERRLNNPYGARVTTEEVYKLRAFLTQGSFAKYINAAKAMDDEQVDFMVDQAASRLGMMRGSVINSNALRQKNERIIAELKVKFFEARKTNPAINPLEFLDNNFEKAKATTSKSVDSALASKVQSRPYKTIQAFDDAIRKASIAQNAKQVSELTRQKNELQDAIDQGIIDKNGKLVKGGQ